MFKKESVESGSLKLKLIANLKIARKHSLKALKQIFDDHLTHQIIKFQINLIWGKYFNIVPDSKTVFSVAELTVDDKKSESFLMTWNKSLEMIHLFDEEAPNYLKIRADQGKIYSSKII